MIGGLKETGVNHDQTWIITRIVRTAHQDAAPDVSLSHLLPYSGSWKWTSEVLRLRYPPYYRSERGRKVDALITTSPNRVDIE